MDITYFIALIVIIALLFFLTKYSQNPMMFGSIIILAALGLNFTMGHEVEVETGVQETYTYNNGTLETKTITPITENFNTIEYFFILYFAISIMVAGLLMSTGWKTDK